MKAWKVFDRYEPMFVSIVYADTRNKAKSIGFKKSPLCFEYYIDIRAVRLKKYDDYLNESCCIDSNDELLNNAPDFWDDSFESIDYTYS